MVVKFFANKKGGSSKAIDYLLNEREQQGTARVLKGDPKLTREIINSIKYKQKTTVGCLSFEEKNISEDMKYQLIEDFEKHLLPGMQDRYNILWVEHTDKGRLELNFVIPKIDLISQKSLNPYYHKADLPRVEKWQDLQNFKYNYSNPKDPLKERNVEINSHIKKFNQSYEELNKTIQELANKGQIQSREQLIELLKDSGIEVTRTGENYISVKLPDSKKARKFKGGIYEQQYTSIEQINGISREAKKRDREYRSRDIQRECERLVTDLESYTQDKFDKLRKQYEPIGKKTRRISNEAVESSSQATQRRTFEDGRESNKKDRGEQQTQDMANSDTINPSNSNNSIRDNILQRRKPIQRETIINPLLLDNKPQQGAINDSTRTAINERISTRESIQYRDYRKTRKSRTDLHKTITTAAESIRKQSITNSRELQEQQQRVTRIVRERAATIEREHKQIIEKSIIHLQQIEAVERTTARFTKLRELEHRLGKAIQSTREVIATKFNNAVNFVKSKFHYKNDNIEKKVANIEMKKELYNQEPTLEDVKNLEKSVAASFEKDVEKYEMQQSQRGRGYGMSR